MVCRQPRGVGGPDRASAGEYESGELTTASALVLFIAAVSGLSGLRATLAERQGRVMDGLACVLPSLHTVLAVKVCAQWHCACVLAAVFEP